MKNIVKTFWIHALIWVCTLSSLWVAYAAWNDRVSDNVHTLTASRWNELLTHVEWITGWSGKFVDGTDTNDAVYTTGNVGVGTTNPNKKLHVSTSDATTEQLRVESTAVDGLAQAVYTNDVKSWQTGIRWDLSDSFVIRETGVADRLTIDTFGQVGIGTSSPEATLHVAGSIKSSGSTARLVCPTGAYGCTIAACVDACKVRWGRLASADEVFGIAMRGNDSCAHGWYYQTDIVANHIVYAAGYVMGNGSSAGCGWGTAGTPRFLWLNFQSTTNYNDTNTYDCYCTYN